MKNSMRVSVLPVVISVFEAFIVVYLMFIGYWNTACYLSIFSVISNPILWMLYTVREELYTEKRRERDFETGF